MTTVVTTPTGEASGVDSVTVVEDPVVGVGLPAPAERTPRPWALAGTWIAVGLACLILVLYVLEPMFQRRTQDDLLGGYRTDIERAANEASGFLGVTTPTKAPEPGAAIGILEIGDVALQQVVVEGVSPAQTQAGPGHVPGTAAPGQPGNSVVLARRAMFGGPFTRLVDLDPGDPILMTTTQGQSVYTVSSVERRTVVEPDATDGQPSASTGGGSTTLTAAGGAVSVDELYGPTDDDRLTLVTSASALPWNSSDAVVVTASLEGLPFEPTPQNGRTDSQTGLHGDPSALAPLVLLLAGLAGVALAAVWLYRHSTVRIAYLLTTPPLVVFTILVAETLSRLLPAWA